MVQNISRGRIPPWAWWSGGGVAVLIAGVVLFLALFDWNLLRGAVAAEASRLSHRPVRIEGDLHVHLLSWTPTATADRVYIGNPPWTHGGRLARVGRLTISIRILPLLVGRVDLPLVDLEQADISLLRDPSGRVNWRLNPNASKPLKLPPIEHFALSDGHVRLVDQKKGMILTGVVQTHENHVAPGVRPSGAFQLTARGAINGDPFALNITGGPLINVRRDRPYPFDADLRAGATHIVAHGVLPKPFDFGHIDTALTVSGDDFARLDDLTGLALPQTTPYRLTGRFLRDGQVYRFHNVSGRVGDSDLEGRFKVDDSTGRPDLRADLHSRRLNYADLGSLVGAAPASAPVTAEQKADRARLKAENRVLPDAALNIGRVRKMDAIVHYSADSVTAPANLPLRQVKLTLILDHGVLRFDPVSFVLPQGELSGTIRIDARGPVPRSDIDLRVLHVHLENFFKRPAQAALEGALEARAVLHGVGDSVHKAASTADGTVTIVVPRGEIRQAFAELMGIDVAKGLGLLFSNDKRETGVRCAVADFQAVHGVLRARTFVVDTDVVTAVGRGDIDLGTEALDLTLQGHPKKLRLFHLSAPVTVTGHFRDPKFGLKPGAAPLQAVGAVALGAVLGPVAAILPFVDAGLTHDANCVSLVNQARTLGAPVKPSATTPNKKR